MSDDSSPWSMFSPSVSDPKSLTRIQSTRMAMKSADPGINVFLLSNLLLWLVPCNFGDWWIYLTALKPPCTVRSTIGLGSSKLAQKTLWGYFLVSSRRGQLNDWNHKPQYCGIQIGIQWDQRAAQHSTRWTRKRGALWPAPLNPIRRQRSSHHSKWWLNISEVSPSTLFRVEQTALFRGEQSWK